MNKKRIEERTKISKPNHQRAPTYITKKSSNRKPLTEEEDLKITTENVKDWRESISRIGWTGFHESWPKDLWKWNYSKIVSFMLERNQQTDNVCEYYDTIPYLIKDMHIDLLDVPFHSRQERIFILPKNKVVKSSIKLPKTNGKLISKLGLTRRIYARKRK